MLMFVRLVIFTATLSIPFVLLSWTDDFHLRFGLPALGLCLLCVAIVDRLRHRSQPPIHSRRRGRLPVNLLHELLKPAAKGLAVVAAMAIYFLTVEQIPGIDAAYRDTDLVQVEEVLTLLEANSSWMEAEQIISKRLHQPLGEVWKRQLVERQIRYLVLAARGERQEIDARALLTKAIACARSHSLPSDLPDAELRALDARARLSEKDQQAKLAVDQVREEVVATHRVELAAFRTRATQAWAQSRYKELVRFGDTVAERVPETAQQEYKTAVALAAKHSLSSDIAAQRLQKVDAALAEAQPLALPPGCRGELIARLNGLVPAVLAMELSLVTADGVPLSGIRAKDLLVSQAGRRLSQLSIVPSRAQTAPGSVAIVLDRSGSMRGQPLQEAKAGIGVLLSQLPAGITRRSYSFANTIEAISEWTHDDREIQSALTAVGADGGTALYATLSRIATEMHDVTAPKAVVLVTDGRDSSQQPIPMDLLTALQKCGAVWHVIGLQSGDLDTHTLAQISQATGGTYVMASHAAELAGQLAKVSQSIHQSIYRLAILDVDPAQSVSIQVGSVSPILITVPPTKP